MCRRRHKRIAGLAKIATAKLLATSMVVVAASDVFAESSTNTTPPVCTRQKSSAARSCPEVDACHRFLKTEKSTIKRIDATNCGTARSMVDIIVLSPNYVYTKCCSFDYNLFSRTEVTDGSSSNCNGSGSSKNQQSSRETVVHSNAASAAASAAD